MSQALYLASQSPRRQQLLQQIGVRFDVLYPAKGTPETAGVDESALANEGIAHYVERLAMAKAQAGYHYMQQQALPPRPILAADTALELDGTILGKPSLPVDACAMLARLAGRCHRVLTAVTLYDGIYIHHELSTSSVHFRALDSDEISRYVASGEPIDKAGAYAVQGLAAVFIREIHGSYSGIMGLPLYETARLLERLGYRWPS